MFTRAKCHVASLLGKSSTSARAGKLESGDWELETPAGEAILPRMDEFNNPFAALKSEGLPPGKPGLPSPPAPKRNRGRVDIIRSKAGRGGKTVTVVKNFVGIGLPEKEALAKKMQKTCGTGGTVKDGQIEIQGDQREAIKRILEEAGFQPVFAGG